MEASTPSDGVARRPGAIVSWRVPAVALLLSLAVGLALWQGLSGGRSAGLSGGHSAGLSGGHSPVAPAAHFHAASHLRTGARSRSHAATKQQGLSSLPASAQAPVSATLGAENPAYRVSAAGGGFAAATPAQRLHTQFSRSGITVSTGSARVGLSLVAWGSGSSLTKVGEVAPSVQSNRVSYARAGLSESYVNGPIGLEQGFTVTSAPSTHAAGPLTLSMALSGNTRASMATDRHSVTFSRAGRPVLRYGGLSATDARGRALHSWLELQGGRLLLRVDAAGARYPLHIDPFVQQGAKLTGSGERGEEGLFGYSVALSSEKGEYALIGGPSDNGNVGAAWVFLRTGTTWAQQGTKLTGKEEAGAGEFGKSVALSEKGETALIGGSGDNEHTGAAWVFTRSSTTWTQQAKLTGKEETGHGEFGLSVALAASEKGEDALIGAPANKSFAGAAYAFVRKEGATTWTQQAMITGKEASLTAEFGYSVSLSPKEGAKEGNLALIGGPRNKEGEGSAWVYLRKEKEAAWNFQALISGKEASTTAEFGKSVAISAEGNYALVGGPGNKEGVGAAWVYFRESGKTTWGFQALLAPKAGEESPTASEFGSSVAIASKEGNYALVGTPDNKEGVGAAWVFLRTTTTWAQQAMITGSGENGLGFFGVGVALSATGEYALDGGFGDREGVGAAWVFLRSGTTWPQQAELTGSGEAREGESSGKGLFGYSVALSEKGEYALIGGPSDNGNVGAAWVFLRSGTTWTQQAILTGKEEAGEGEFGKSVALSATGETALIGGSGDSEHAGAAWVFTRSSTTWAQQGSKLTGSGATGPAEFGFSVALAASEKGEDALIGGPGNKEFTGAAWVFVRKEGATTWAQQAMITGKEATATAEFGYSVSLSPKESTKEGDLALIGGPKNKEGAGAAWVYLRKEKETTWNFQALITGKEASTTAEFGSSVAISTEGNYALIGGPNNGATGKEVGAAWVYFRESGKTTWGFQALLTPKAGEETEHGEFGDSVAIAAKEGNYALVSAPANKEGTGASWVFLRTTTTWAQQGEKLTGGGENGPGLFGAGVAALSATGEYALMGGYRDSAEVGAAWVFLRSGTTWTQQGEKLTGKEETGAGESRPGKGEFGYSVALASEGGNTALIGGPTYLNGVGASIGAAWVFTRSGSTWTQQGLKLTGGEEIGGAEFGHSVALSANGNTALIGGFRDNGNVGAAWVFTRASEKWTQQGPKITGTGEVGAGEFGVSVALSPTGEYALIGGFGDSEKAGAAWVFTSSAGKWTQQAELTPKAGEEIGESEFGQSVALSSEANTALIGANGDNANAGAAWVFTRAGTTWSQQGGKLTGGGETGPGDFGAVVALSAEGNAALIGGPGDNEGAGAAWTFTRSGSTWTPGAKLTGSGGVGKGEFGAAVALSAKEGNYALIGGPLDHEGIGAAWVYTRSGTTWTQLGEKLTGKEEVGGGGFGASVALSSEGNTALIGGNVDSGGVGGAWVFVNTSPTAITKPASAITQTTATLNATVNPDGGKVTKCEFEYGTTTSYGTKASCASLPAGEGAEPVAVTAAITGLTSTTTYHFRILATNAAGTSTGSDETFKTLGPPTVLTEKASAIAQTTASLNATVNPNNGEVSKCEFEYGETNSYGKAAPCASLPGSGSSPVAVSAALTGLTANTTYHFRISATNAGGTSKGSDETFKTAPPCTAEGYCATFTAPNNIEGSLKEPNGTAVDPSGDIFVADSGHDRVLEFNSARVYLRQFGSEGTGEGQFKAIGGIAVNKEGDVYVSDYGNGRVQEFSPTGAHLRTFGTKGTGSGQLYEPTGVAIDASGNVWVRSTYGVLVQEFSATGTLITGFGSAGFVGWTAGEAGGLAISGGNLYVPELTRVQEFSTAGASIRTFDEGGAPHGIASDPVSGNVYVTEPAKNRVQEFSSTGTAVGTFGTAGSGSGQLSNPLGVGVGPSETVYVADTGNNRIEEWAAASKPATEAPTFATSFTAPSNIEGSLKAPNGVAADPSGDIFVSDSGHDRVLEFNSKREYLRQFGSEGTGEGQFKAIGGIASNKEGDVYVTDYGNGRVQEFSPTGTYLRKFATQGTGSGQVYEPTGVAIDSSGNVWVRSSYGVLLQEFSGTGTYMAGFGTAGFVGWTAGEAGGLAISGGNLYVPELTRVQEFSTAGASIRTFDEGGAPHGIASDPVSGNVYVTEPAKSRVQDFTSTGTAVATFGTAGSGAGQLSDPLGVGVGPAGYFYIADTGNNRVEEWKTNP